MWINSRFHSPPTQAFIALVVVAALHYGNSFLSFRLPAFEALTAGKPRVLIQDGEMQRQAMAAEHVNEQELLSLLRENQVDSIKDVAEGILEINGQLSIRKTEQAKELEKRDLNGRKRVKQAA